MILDEERLSLLLGEAILSDPYSRNIGDLFLSITKQFSLTEAKQIGDALGIDWQAFAVEQFQLGLKVELEYGAGETQTNLTDDDAVTTGKIAWAHLIEFPDYYTHLSAMEKDADEYWANL